MARMRRTSRSRRPCARGDVLCAEPGRSHPCPDLLAGPAREGISRTPSMYVDEKSDEATVPRKRPNKGRQLPAEVVEGRASPKGNSRQTAVVRTLSRAAALIRLAAVRRTAGGFKPCAADVRPEGGARCVSSARRDLCGGRGEILVPTATIGCALRQWFCCRFLPLSKYSPEPIGCLLLSFGADMRRREFITLI